MTRSLVPFEHENHKKANVMNTQMTWIVLSAFNGALYFFVSHAGGENLESFLNIQGPSANHAINAISIASSLVYTMFMYKTFEALTLRPNTKTKVALSLLAPFAASAFLTAGKEGATAVGSPDILAFLIGFVLLAFRILNCIDANVKFPSRLKELTQAWSKAGASRDTLELARLIFTWVVGIGYSIATTDAVYNSTTIILNWISITNKPAITTTGYIFAGLGAVATLPLNLYWTHRGLKQLTYGGACDTQGNVLDPTDRYTFIGSFLVLPVILGILGGATASQGAVFGQLGLFAQIVRVSTSAFYGICAGTPGMATLCRSISYKCRIRFYNERPLLNSTKSETENQNQAQL